MNTHPTLPWLKYHRRSGRVLQCQIAFDSFQDQAREVFLISDGHLDSTHCDEATFRKHLRMAVKRNAGVFFVGDMSDAMQGRQDRRGSKADVKPELKVADYWDALVRHNAEIMAEAGPNIIGHSYGNHELSVLQKSETALPDRICEALRVGDYVPPVLGYRGWLLFRTLVGGRGGRGIKMYFTHGSGGSSPVTRGTIKNSRRAVTYPDADLVVSGHTHDNWSMPVPRSRVTSNGVIYQDEQWHVCLGSYKTRMEDDEALSWEDERELEPRKIGGWVLQIPPTRPANDQKGPVVKYNLKRIEDLDDTPENAA